MSGEKQARTIDDLLKFDSRKEPFYQRLTKIPFGEGIRYYEAEFPIIAEQAKTQVKERTQQMILTRAHPRPSLSP